jgi:hypothetical protein
MVRASNSTLEKAPDILNTIGIRLPKDLLHDATVNRLMACVVICKSITSKPFIAVDHFCVRRQDIRWSLLEAVPLFFPTST